MKNRRPGLPEEAAYIDLVRTADLLSRPLAQLLKSEDLSPAQYNVLRILRGSPEGLPCGDVGGRMITRDPDITRLFDRMENRGLITRVRDDKDRRVVLARIAPEGIEVLARLDRPVRETHRKLLGHLGEERMRALAILLQACRERLE